MPISKKSSHLAKTNLRTSVPVCRAYLCRTINCFLAGDIDNGKTILTDYIVNTIGFTALSNALGYKSKSLIRMLSAKGEPRIGSFFAIIAYLQKIEGADFEVVAKRAG